MMKPVVDPELEELRQEYNAAIANGLIGKARMIDRRYRVHERKMMNRKSTNDDNRTE